MMDDGSGKCLLDVINDPSALQEFLKSNSQERKIDSSMTVASQSASIKPAYVNHTVTPSVLNARSVQGTTVDKRLPPNTTHVPLVSRTLINNTNVPHSSVAKADMKTSSRRSSGLSQASGIGLVPSAVPVSTGVNFLKTPTSSSSLATSNGDSNRTGIPPVVVSSNVGAPVVGKPVVTSLSSFQGKKPIPIQPKTHITGVVNKPATVPVQENRLSNVQLINPVVSVVTQKQPIVSQQNMSSIVHNVTLNGVDGKGGNLCSPKSSPVVNQHSHSTTPVKRIAPKQPNILPQTGVSSPPQLIGTQHKVILPQVTHQITSHVQGAVNQVSSASIPHQNQTQFIQAQQLLNLIRSQTPNVVTTQQQTAQLAQSQSIPANQIRQIQHLVQQKLSGQQQPSIVQQVQQKVLSPAQLQATLKQNQQPGSENQTKAQPQSIVVQEEVISQLIQQFQNQQQQQQPRTPLQGVMQQQQQQQTLQQLQQQQQIQGVQKHVLLQNVHSLGQQTAPMQVKLSSQVSVQNQRTAASPVSAQIQQIGDLQQKQLQQMLGQQQVNISPQHKLVATREQAAKQIHSMTFAQGQQLRTASPQGLQQGLQQSKPALQQLKAMTTPALQIVASNPQTVVSDTQQQQVQNVGVQKVFIIKQPELLQKLGLQGNKTQQTIQITPQQLQVLKQIQLQQQTQQKLLGNSTQAGSNLQPKVLMTDQLKHLQQQLQSQGVKQVTVQGRTQQQLLQQQRQVTVKAQSKMQHIPRILQTTGRQPVSQGAVKVSLPIKQEPNKGVKRPHSSDTTEIPKVATRLKQGLLQDQQAVLHPDLTTPFASQEDAVKRLAPYHVCYDSSPSSADVQKADGLFSAVATQLVKRSQRMMERHRQLLFDESMREHPSAEMVMLYRVFLTDERAALAQERKLAKEEPLEIATASKGETTDEKIPSNEVSSAVNTSENTAGKYNSQTPQGALPSATVKCENDFVKSMKSTDSAASSGDTSYLLNTKISSSPSVNSSNVCTTKKGTTSSSLPSKMQTLSSSASSSINHPTKYSPSGIKALQQSNKHNHKMENSQLHNFDSSLDVTEESDMGTEMEKEDVTATLALLNSMASELDEVLDVEGGL